MPKLLVHMKPNKRHITIQNNLSQVEEFINEIIIQPKHALTRWAKVTNQTPAAKIGYIGQHLASLITGVRGTGSGARGDDLADGSEVKSCNKIDQVDKCKKCGARVLRMENECSSCGSTDIIRKDDSKWLFTVRDEHELKQYLEMERVVLLLMDYPNFSDADYKDIRITAFEIYPQEPRMSVFCKLIENHYYNIYIPKLKEGKKTNPMNLHPWSFQFYKCNPIKTFECIIKDIDTNPIVVIDSENYVSPSKERGDKMSPLPMPSSLLKAKEWKEMLSKADFCSEILPNISNLFLVSNNLNSITKKQFSSLRVNLKAEALPYLTQTLRDYISLRPIKSSTQKQHYQRS